MTSLKLPELMLACFYNEYGGPEKDKVFKIPTPRDKDLKENQLLIQVYAASLNPADYKQRSGGATKFLLSSKFPQIYG